jgi:hypothetical protein
MHGIWLKLRGGGHSEVSCVNWYGNLIHIGNGNGCGLDIELQLLGGWEGPVSPCQTSPDMHNQYVLLIGCGRG